MAIDRQGTGLAILRVFIGVFFLFEGIGKYRWFMNPSLLAGQLSGWMQSASPGSISISIWSGSPSRTRRSSRAWFRPARSCAGWR